jgi:hypothetical protein
VFRWITQPSTVGWKTMEVAWYGGQRKQMNKECVRARAIRYGRWQYRLTAKELPGLLASLLGILMLLLLHILARGARLGCTKLSSDREKLFKSWWELNCLIGKPIEARQLFQERASSTVSLG